MRSGGVVGKVQEKAAWYRMPVPTRYPQPLSQGLSALPAPLTQGSQALRGTKAPLRGSQALRGTEASLRGSQAPRGREGECSVQRKQNAALVSYARQLRKNMTPHERRLWFCFLKQYPVRFVRQKVLGSYIVDFYCAEARLAVELDGAQHYEDKAEKQDQLRTAFLQKYGLQVIRISNQAVDRQFFSVCSQIDALVKKRLGKSDKKLQ